MNFGNQTAVIATLGASLRRYFITETADSVPVELDIIWGYSGASNKQGGQGDVLIPFPSRIKGGAYTFNGDTHQMERNDKEGPNAIHGFLRTVGWSISEQTESQLRLQTTMRREDFAPRGYPYSLDASLEYRLSSEGLKCAFAITNTGETTAPVGVGFHPYFLAGKSSLDEAETLIPASSFVEFENLVPTGKLISVEGTPSDYRSLKPIGSARFNHCYTDLKRDADGLTRAYLVDSETRRKTCIWMDKAFNYLVVYSGDAIEEPFRRKAFAIEPMTCGTNAFNVHEWGLKSLIPGEDFQGSFGIHLENAPAS
ncbi:MAG: hypothetical protein H7222_05450 [Methylotenera sp.]|nr:hypothetical protein [Oligoflexia bacterium]